MIWTMELVGLNGRTQFLRMNLATLLERSKYITSLAIFWSSLLMRSLRSAGNPQEASFGLFQRIDGEVEEQRRRSTQRVDRMSLYLTYAPSADSR